MKFKVIFIINLFFIVLSSCQKEETTDDNFSKFLSSIPDLKLPFITNSAEDLQAAFYPDTMYNKFIDDSSNGIYGKIKVNDSIHGVVFLLPGDILFPLLVTYNSIGKRIDELDLVHLPGGSDGYNANGSSYLVMNNKLEILITDTIHTFERDSLTEIIDSTKKTKVVIEKYFVDGLGKIVKHE